MHFLSKSIWATLFSLCLVAFTFAEKTEEAEAAPAEPQQAWLGVYVKPLPDALRAQLAVGKSVGLLVEEVVPNSPASEAGLKPFDVLLAFDNQKLFNRDQLHGLVLDAKPSSNIQFQIIRAGKTLDFPVTLGAKSLKTKKKTPWENIEMDDDIRKMLESFTENPEIKSALSEAKGEIAELIRSVSESLPSEDEIKENIAEALRTLTEEGAIVHDIEIIREQEDTDSDPVMRRSRILNDATEVNYSDRHGDIRVKSADNTITVRIIDDEEIVVYEGPLTEKTLLTLERRDSERLQNLLKMHEIEVAQAE
ncbi:MAG: S1C family serine protease [Opitutales bacterium]